MYEKLAKAKPGQKLRDPGFGSYSAIQSEAKGFLGYLDTSKNILFKTRNKSLTPINMFSDLPSEQEAILPRNTEQTIRSITKDGNTLIVELD